MWSKPSLMMRIAIGKSIGFVIGLVGFFLLPYYMPEADPMFRWGILFWYITLGAIIGMFGVFTYHPILKLPMPWWFRAPFMGGWLNFVLTLFIYDDLKPVMIRLFGDGHWLSSPFWFVLEGAIIGLFIGYLATRFAGEGKEAVGQ